MALYIAQFRFEISADALTTLCLQTILKALQIKAAMFTTVNKAPKTIRGKLRQIAPMISDQGEYITALKQWAELPFEEEQPRILGLKVVMSGTRSFLFQTGLSRQRYAYMLEEQAKVGFAERVALFLSLHRIDKNRDGTVTDEEIESNEDMVNSIVSNYNSLLQNFGVIAALIVSVFFPLQFAAPSSVAQESVDFFGETVTKAIAYAYLGALNMCVVISVVVILKALQEYKQLNFWMSTPEAQLRCLQTKNVTSVIVLGQALMVLIMGVIPFGTIAYGSPISALISTVVVLMGCIYWSQLVADEEVALRILHKEVKIFFEDFDKQEQLKVSPAVNATTAGHPTTMTATTERV